MYRKFLKLNNTSLLFLFFIVSGSLFAQDENDTIVKMTNNHLFLTINENMLLNAPSGVEVKPTSVSADINWFLVLAGRKSLVSIDIGYGCGTYSLKTNSVFEQDSLTHTQFNTSVLDTTHYIINKFSAVYFEIPLEFRIRSRPDPLKNRNFVFTLGAKIGFLLSDYHKYLGDDYRGIRPGDEVKFKEYYQKNLLRYRYGVYSRIGYGKFYIYGFYSLNSLFDEDGPDVFPMSFGIGLNLYRSKAY